MLIYTNNGDDMKMNIIIPVICAVLLGYLCASFIFNQYGALNFAFNDDTNIYYLQCGAYTNKEASEKTTNGISEKITIKEGEKYYSYIGMTANSDVAKNIQSMYKEKGVDIYIKSGYLDNNDFISQLNQYDILLEASKNLTEINSVLKTVLATYDEIILNP